MRLAFMGSDAIALPMLRFIHAQKPAGIEVAMVFTQPDRKTGRGMLLKVNAIKKWALEENLPVHQPVKCSSEESQLLVREGIDVVLVMAFGQILPTSLLEACPLGTLNIHASLLPRLRGASPIHTAIALGLKETGLTLMRVTPKLDSGPMAARELVPILPGETAPQLIQKLSARCVPLMEKALPELVAGKLEFVDQDPDEVTYCRIIEKTDAHMDFKGSAGELVDRIRAFQPWPGTVFPYQEQDLRILAAEATEPTGAAPGTLILDDSGSVLIACGHGALRLLTLQRAGGRPLESSEFLRGFPLQNGYRIESLEMRALEKRRPFPYRKKRNHDA